MMTQQPVHRFQLAYVANFELGSMATEQALQGCLELGVARSLWKQSAKGDGLYCFTEDGLKQSQALKLSTASRAYSPAAEPKFSLSGRIGQISVVLTRLGKKKFEVRIAEETCKSGEEAIRKLNKIDSTIAVKELVPRSQPAELYNLAVSRKFIGKWDAV